MQPTYLWMTTTNIRNDYHNEQPMAQLTTVNCAAAVATAITDHARRAGHGDHVDGISAQSTGFHPSLLRLALVWSRLRGYAVALTSSRKRDGGGLLHAL